MKTLLSISALLLTIMLMQMGTTALGPLDTLSAIELGFSNTEIGAIGGAHFLGFLVGCLFSPLLVKRVGHARAYCVTAALSIIAILLHPVLPYFWAWCLFRVMTGIAIATSYTAVESWLNAKLTNKNRGQFFGVYRIIDMTGALIAQAMIIVLIPAYFLSYSMLAILICLSLMPLGLTKTVQPAMPETQKIDVLFAFRISPLAALGVLTVGATGSALRMIGPLFAYQLNFTPTQIGLFLSLPLIAGMIIQFPIGYMAERATPRQLIGGLSAITILISIAFSVIEAESVFGIKTIFILVFIFGLTTMPLYSLSAIHANNQIKEQDMTMLSASLIFLFGIGAIVSPVIASYIIEHFGPLSMFTYFAAMHLFLLGYTGYRALIRPLNIPLRPYIYIPRTSLFIAKTIKNLRRRPH
jgi:MFS family permease